MALWRLRGCENGGNARFSVGTGVAISKVIMTNNNALLESALKALSGKGTPADVLLGRLCEIRRECAPKWERFKAGAAAQMGLSVEQVASIVAYVESY